MDFDRVQIKALLRSRGLNPQDLFLVSLGGTTRIFIPEDGQRAFPRARRDQGTRSARGEVRELGDRPRLIRKRRITGREILWDETLSFRREVARPSPVRRQVEDSSTKLTERKKKKVAGNLCVNTGKGSGGGFTPCATLTSGKGSATLTPGAAAARAGKISPATPAAFKAALTSNKRADTLSDYNLDDLGSMKLFLLDGHKVGYAIKDGDELVNLFNSDTKERAAGAGKWMVLHSIEQGARRGDHFDGFLTGFYKKMGFAEESRSANWTPGGPDVVFIKWAAGPVRTARARFERAGRLDPTGLGESHSRRPGRGEQGGRRTRSPVRTGVDESQPGAAPESDRGRLWPNLSEAKKKLAGNLCVNTGQGSGGGFVPCNTGATTKAPAKSPRFPKIRKDGIVGPDISLHPDQVYWMIGTDKLRAAHQAVQHLKGSGPGSFTESERVAMRRYTLGTTEGMALTKTTRQVSFWITLGRLSRDGAKASNISKEDLAEFRRGVDGMDSALQKLPKIDSIAYRGFDAAKMKLKDGQEFTTKSIMSSSVHAGVAARFALNETPERGARDRSRELHRLMHPMDGPPLKKPADLLHKFGADAASGGITGVSEYGRTRPALMRIRGGARLLGAASAVPSEFESIHLPGQRFKVVKIHRNVKTQMDRPSIGRRGIEGIGTNPFGVDVYDVVAIGQPGSIELKEARQRRRVIKDTGPEGRFTSTEFLEVEDSSTEIDEVKVKIAGNLCVNKGPNTGGGFTACSGTHAEAFSKLATDKALPSEIRWMAKKATERDGEVAFRGRLPERMLSKLLVWLNYSKGARINLDLQAKKWGKDSEQFAFQKSQDELIAKVKGSVTPLKGLGTTFLIKRPYATFLVATTPTGRWKWEHGKKSDLGTGLYVMDPADAADLVKKHKYEATTMTRRFPTLDEAKKKLAGNLCVNTGQGSGGGFVPCAGVGGTTANRGPKRQGKTSPTNTYASRAKKFSPDASTSPVTLAGGIKLQVTSGPLSNKLGKIKVDDNTDMCRVSPPLCKGNLGIPRAQMPQLDGPTTQAFLQAYRDDGIKVRSVKMSVGALKATQREIRASKSLGMAKSVVEGKFNSITNPIVVSKDGYVLDGHHRWAALRTLSPSNKMPVVQVDVSIQDMLKRAGSFKGVATASFGEAQMAMTKYTGFMKWQKAAEAAGHEVRFGFGAKADLAVARSRGQIFGVFHTERDIGGLGTKGAPTSSGWVKLNIPVLSEH